MTRQFVELGSQNKSPNKLELKGSTQIGLWPTWVKVGLAHLT